MERIVNISSFIELATDKVLSRWKKTANHRLRGSASAVLTATGFVNGKGLQNRHPSTDHQKIVTGDYVGDHYGCDKLGAYPSTGGLLGTWVKYNQNYFYL